MWFLLCAVLAANQVRVEQPTTFTVEPGPVATIPITEPGIYEFGATKVGEIPAPPPPPLPPAEGAFIPGAIPADGYHATGSERYIVQPSLQYGQRLSGTMTIKTGWIPSQDIQWRVLIDGVPQASKTIDTTQIADGTHVLSCQVMDQAGWDIRSGSVVVVVNNSNHPFRELAGQAVLYQAWNGGPQAGLAWGRVDALEPQAYPLDPQLELHPSATTDADRQRLAKEKVWWVEGLNHQGTPLWQSLPIVMKNASGDYFIAQFNPQGGGAGTWAIQAQPWMKCAPAYDGPRGIGMLSPYSTLSADRHHVLWDGQTGWIGVDKAGRVVQVSITGEVRTLLGPRSVASAVQTDYRLTQFTLEQRIAAGEKEYVGDHGGQPLDLSHDIWVCDSFPFEGVIADTANNQIREFHFPNDTHPQAYLMRKWPIAGVTSVWGTERLQKEKHIAWVAAAPDGLWCQHVQANENLGRIGPVNHEPPNRVADITNAFWVRAIGLRAIVLTLNHAIYEYDFATDTMTQRKGPYIYNGHPYDYRFVFGALDEFGSIGPVGRFYYGGSLQKTSISWIDTNTWEQGSVSKGGIINSPWQSWVAKPDPFGHYLWGFSMHTTLPKIVSAGISSSSWFLWSACLGDKPINDPSIKDAGVVPWRNGKIDEALAPASVYGYHGHGQIGYSCDQFRDFRTWEEAKPAIMEALQPFFGASQSQQEREAVGHQLFLQRTRKHFQ